MSDSAVGWWWSQTLLCWVVAACPLVQRAAVQRGLGPWLVLAHVVAAFAVVAYHTHTDYCLVSRL